MLDVCVRERRDASGIHKVKYRCKLKVSKLVKKRPSTQGLGYRFMT